MPYTIEATEGKLKRGIFSGREKTVSHAAIATNIMTQVHSRPDAAFLYSPMEREVVLAALDAYTERLADILQDDQDAQLTALETQVAELRQTVQRLETQSA